MISINAFISTECVDRLLQVSDVWSADEFYVKIKGNLKYLSALTDDETRFWIAQEVIDTKFTHDARELSRLGKEIVSKTPATLITDGLQSYHDAYLKECWTVRKNSRTRPVCNKKLQGEPQNNKTDLFFDNLHMDGAVSPYGNFCVITVLIFSLHSLPFLDREKENKPVAVCFALNHHL